MIKKFCIISIYIIFLTSLSAQESRDISILQKNYEVFQYDEVIKNANKMLSFKSRYNEDALIEIYTLKAASHFAIGEQTNSRKAFLEILKFNEDFQLDKVRFSPKLLEYYNNVKTEFLEIVTSKDNVAEKKDDYKNIDSVMIITDTVDLRVALAKSLMFPGLGHFTIKENTKGWILTSAGILALGSMVYFISDTHSKEETYLKEKNSTLLQSRYDSYNKAYKMRNSLIIAYAAIWLYSQIDILFFSNSLYSGNLSLNSPNKLTEFMPTDLVFTLHLEL